MNLGQIIDPARVWEGATHNGETRRERQPAPVAMPPPRTVMRVGDEDRRVARPVYRRRRRNRPAVDSIAHEIRVQLDLLGGVTFRTLHQALPGLSRKQVLSNLGGQIHNNFVRTEGLRRHYRYLLTETGKEALRMALEG